LPGKNFDALFIDLNNNPQIPFNPDQPFTLYNLFEKFIFCGDDRCISQVFVQGKVVIDNKTKI
jgi:cytosine/adenosine deaminase-related metal-dependent hydrolase